MEIINQSCFFVLGNEPTERTKKSSNKLMNRRMKRWDQNRLVCSVEFIRKMTMTAMKTTQKKTNGNKINARITIHQNE